jgi:GT2 family glycosyltransferase
MLRTSSREQAIKVSVIIPVWNGRQYLRDCLDALLGQGYADCEIIVVDNASSDGSGCFVSESYPNVRLVRNEQNLGFAGGCNAGLRTAQGELLVLLNQDTVVRPGWIVALVNALQEPDIGVAGCKILYPDGETIQHAGGWIGWPLGLAYHYGRGERDEGQWDSPRTVEYVTGAAMALRRDVLDRVGLLDEGFWPGYFEDTDLCCRVRDAGYKVLYVPSATLTHQENTSIRDPHTIARACQRGRLRFVLKRLSPERFLAEFVPAEGKGKPEGIWGMERGTAYLETTPIAAPLLLEHWHADRKTVHQVLEALQQLYRKDWETEWNEIIETIGSFDETRSFLESGLKSPFLSLREFEFRSSTPIVGPLLARLRSFWYSIAARWGILHLIHQQQAINRQQNYYIRSLEQRVAALATDIEFLAQEIADQALQIDPDKRRQNGYRDP